MGERYDGLMNLFQRCAAQYNDEDILRMPFNCQDRGWEGILQHLDIFPDGYSDPYVQKILFNFTPTVSQNINSVQYSMCYNKNTPKMANFCGPDWVFYHWPTASIESFATTRDEIIAASANPPTIPKVGWYGNIYSPLKDVPEHSTRPLLKELGDKYNSMFDIVHVQPNYGIIDANTPNYTSLVDLMQYKYLIDIGGNGYSGRLKFLLFSKRPILLVDRNYIEYFHYDLEPWVHYVPVQMDLTNLITQIKWLENNYDEALKIAQNAYNFAMRNFTEEKLNERIYTVYQNINTYRGNVVSETQS
jgi:hypothetical protein